MDTGTTLQMELETGERLEILSSGTSYEFTSSYFDLCKCRRC